LVEARKQSHITSKQEINLEQLEQKTITLADPIPLYGSLDINSTPLESSVYLDGKIVGETPLFLDKVLIGSHSLLIKKDGYGEETTTVDVEESKTKEVDIQLDESSDNVFQVVEEAPEFPGGTQALLDYLRKNIKYPEECRKKNIQGRVMVSFIINKDGTIVEPEVVKGVDPLLDKEALRVISKMPQWKPGVQRGKPVRVKYTVPVNFRLN
jgi:protein TonB